MKEANKILKKVFALDKQIKTGKTNKYPLIRLIDKHMQEICHQLGLDANSTFLDIDNRLKQIKFESQKIYNYGKVNDDKSSKNLSQIFR